MKIDQKNFAVDETKEVLSNYKNHITRRAQDNENLFPVGNLTVPGAAGPWEVLCNYAILNLKILKTFLISSIPNTYCIEPFAEQRDISHFSIWPKHIKVWNQTSKKWKWSSKKLKKRKNAQFQRSHPNRTKRSEFVAIWHQTTQNKKTFLNWKVQNIALLGKWL